MRIRFEITDVSALALFRKKNQSSKYKGNEIEHMVITKGASLDYWV